MSYNWFGEVTTERSATAISRHLLKILLLLTIVAAYLNPILRTSEDSILTGFRVMLPFVAGLCFLWFWRWDMTKRFVLYFGAVLVYSIGQMSVFGLLSDDFVWSYLINIVAVVVFVYFVYLYKILYGACSLFRHLYFWYAVLVLASVHQLLTGFTYPNAPYLEGVARIFYGQENDSSLAIAAFLPILLYLCRRDPLAFLFLGLGLYVLYINNTRGVLVAVAVYPLMVAGAWATDALRHRLAIPRPLTAALVVFAGLSTILFVQDAPIALSDHISSLRELAVEPVMEIAAGEERNEELTSINLRVALAIVGLQKFISTLGFGIGPGASTYFVREYYEGVALSMHIFWLQLMIECGWLFLGTMAWIVLKWGPGFGWRRFVPLFVFFNLATFSITSGAITNYYFFACAVFALTDAPPAHSSDASSGRVSPYLSRVLVGSRSRRPRASFGIRPIPLLSGPG